MEKESPPPEQPITAAASSKPFRMAPPKPQQNFKKISTHGHSQLAADIIQQLTSNTYECIICCEKIRRQVPSWNCSTCHMIFHFSCVQKWSQSSEEG